MVDGKGDTVVVDTSITKSGRPQKILTASLRSDINATNVPSIPSPGQAHGYSLEILKYVQISARTFRNVLLILKSAVYLEKERTGQLKKQKGPKHDRTMGPAYYRELSLIHI